MADNVYDAIVVGSGISGGWAAKELTEKGLKVIMLERGKNIEHVKDYTETNKAPWEFPHRGRAPLSLVKEYPVLSRDYPLNEINTDWWASDKDCPYTEVKRFDWFRGYHVGGRSLMWGRQSYRLSDFDFEANAKDGVAVDWPVRYKDIAPWYDYVEKFAGISGNRDGLPQLPDGQYLPPMDLTCVEKDAAARIKATLQGKKTSYHRAGGACQRSTGGANAMPVPEQMRHRVSLRRIFQHAVIHVACSNEDGQPDTASVEHRDKGALRQRHEESHRC